MEKISPSWPQQEGSEECMHDGMLDEGHEEQLEKAGNQKDNA